MRNGKTKLRIVIAKAGLDGHDRGAKIVARALRDAEIEVIYTGRRQTPEQIVNAAIQEGADAIGLSVLSGAHEAVFSKVLDLLRQKDARDIIVFGGGIIPVEDAEELKNKGVVEIFGPGSHTEEIAKRIRSEILARRRREA